MRRLLICKAAFFLAVVALVGHAGFAVLAAFTAAIFAGKWAAFLAALAGGGRWRFAVFSVCGLVAGSRLFWRAASAAWWRAVLAFWPCVFQRPAIQNAIARLQSQWFLFDGGGGLASCSSARSRQKSGVVRANTFALGGVSDPKIGRQTLKNGQKWPYQGQSGKSIQAPTKRLCKAITPAANGGGSDARQGSPAAKGGGRVVGQSGKNCCKKW